MEKLGRYKIVGEIDRGNMGVVYKAVHPMMKRVVAIKTMSSKIRDDPALRSRFFREAEAVSQLSHRNIIIVHDMGEDSGEVYLVMEFLEGENLKTIIDKTIRGEKEPLSLEARLEIFLQICDGLAYAHGKGVIHRDIKPGNIFVTRSGDVKILDFGLARLVASDLTGTEDKMGTPAYMSPEQLQSSKVDARSDAYSAGVVFYELLTYTKVFSAESLPAIFFKIVNVDPEPIDEINPVIPHQLAEIVRKSMAKNPADRYQSMSQMREDLEDFEQLLIERKRALHEEAREALARLDKLIQDNRELLKEAAEKLNLIKLAAPTLFITPEVSRRSEGTLGRPSGLLDYFEIAEICDGAKREYSRLIAQLERRKRSGPLLDEATELERNGEFADALEIVDGLLQDDPSFTAAQSLRKKIIVGQQEQQLEEQKEQEVAALYEEAEARFAVNDLAGCLTSLADILRIRPEHKQATALLERAQRNLALQAERKEKQRQVSRLLAGARRALAAGQFEEARKAVAGALDILPDATEPTQLLKEIARAEEEYRAKREREEQIGRLLAEAESLEEAGEETGALDQLQVLLALDPEHSTANRLQGQIEKRRSARKAAEKLFENAELKYSSDDFAGCIPVLAEALNLHPTHQGAIDLLQHAKQKIEERAKLQRERRRGEQALTAVQKALLGENMEEARRQLERAREICQTEEGAAGLIGNVEQAEGQYRRNVNRAHRINEMMGQAKECHHAGEHERALAILAELEATAPGYQKALELAASIRQFQKDRENAERERLKKITDCLNDALQAEKSGDLEQADRLAHEVLEEDAGHAEANELLARLEVQFAERRRAEEEKKEQIQSLLDQTHQARAQGRYEEALQALDDILAMGHRPPEILALHHTITSDYQSEKTRLAKLAEGKRQKELGSARLAAKQYQESLDAFKLAREMLGDDPSIASGIAKADEGIRNQERLAAIRTLIIKCRQALGQEDFKQASECAGKVLIQDPQNAEAKDLISRIEQAQELKRIRLEVAALLAYGHQALAKEEFQGAAKAASEVLSLDPLNNEAREILTKANYKQQEKHDIEAIASLLVQANQAFARSDLRQAATLLRELLQRSPQNAEAKTLLDKIQSAQEEQSRREQVSAKLALAHKCRQENNLFAAAQALRHILENLEPGNKAARALLKDIEKEQKAQEKARRAAALEASRKNRGDKLRRLGLILVIAAVAFLAIGGITWKIIDYYREERYARAARDLFQKGSYELAAAPIDRWLAEYPRNNSAQRLKSDNMLAARMLKTYNEALSEKAYSKASNALDQLRRINPTDPGLGQYRDRMNHIFSAEFSDSFQGDLSGWSIPDSWRREKGKLVVSEGLGTIRARRYSDFQANFNVQFITSDTASWILRVSDSSNYYRFQLTGPKGNPPNSFLGVKVEKGLDIPILPPIRVGKNMGKAGEQYEITAVARGEKIQHFINIDGETKELGTAVYDSTFPSGTFGFSAKSGESFYVYGGFGIFSLKSGPKS